MNTFATPNSMEPSHMVDRSQAVVTYINGGSDAVEGWLYRLDMVLWAKLDFVQKSFGSFGDLCEVGVYKGKALALLGMLARDEETVFAFDAYPNDWLGETQKTMQAFCPWRSDIRYVQGNTASLGSEALGQVFPRKLRLLHIDAGHEYHEVLHTLCLFAPFLAAEGVIIMDDYHDHEFPGVAAATLDFCWNRETRPFVPFLAGANKMYLCMPGLAERYQLALLAQPELKDTMRLSRIRNDIVLVSGSREPMSSDGMRDVISRDTVDALGDATLASLAKVAARNSQSNGQASLGIRP